MQTTCPIAIPMLNQVHVIHTCISYYFIFEVSHLKTKLFSGPAEHGFNLKMHTETIYLLLQTNTQYFYMIITTHYKATTSVIYVLAIRYK